MRVMRKIIVLLVLINLTHWVEGAPAVKFSGSYFGYLWNDPTYYNPGASDEWLWDTWQQGHTFYAGSPVIFLGGARTMLNMEVGRPQDSFYASIPFRFSLNANHSPEHVRLLTNISNYIFMAKSPQLTVSLSTRDLRWNDFWVYKPMQDPLGALKLPNTTIPRLTFKIAAKVQGWDVLGYLLADERCNFLPKTETVPTEAYNVLSAQIGSGATMNYFDEMPIYRLLRSSRKIGNNITLGFLWGQKQAENIYPREKYEHRAYNPTVINNIGYLKENIGFDLQGTLPLANRPFFTFAAISSQGEWRKYSQLEGLGKLTVWDRLGKVKGNALKVEAKEVKLGKLSISSTFHSVDPDFQWVAARDSRYTNTMSFLSPSDPYVYAASWRSLLDEDFHYRDPRQKEQYLSDVASYLGLRTAEYLVGVNSYLKLTSTISFPTKLNFKLTTVNNLREGDASYFDPINWQYQKKPYQELKAKLELGDKSKLNILGQKRSFRSSKQDFQDLVGLEYSTSVEEMRLTGELKRLERQQFDSDLVRGVLRGGKIALEGENKGIKSLTMLDYRSGTYDSDLVKENLDHVYAEPYSYLNLGQYAEFIQLTRVGFVPVRIKYAGEIKRQTTNLADLGSGTSLIGYMESQIRVNPNFSLTLTGLAVNGPKGQAVTSFGSNVLSSLIDSEITLRPFGSKDNTFTFRVTRRFREDGPKTNIIGKWNMRLGRHSLSFEYGRAPYSTNTGQAFGLPMDVKSYPEREVIGKPWAIWSEAALYSLDTSKESHNYMTLTWFTNF